MFGTLRFCMAVAVVITHIGGIEVIAGIAVWGFFMLSGFLMTAVLNAKYGFSKTGIARFFASRAIRLYPLFWMVTVLSLFSVVCFGGYVAPGHVSSSMMIPVSFRDIFANLVIFGHTTFGIGRIEHSLIPSAWAVDVELLMYIISVLLVSRSRFLAQSTVVLLAFFFPVLWFYAKQLISHGQVDLGGQLIYSFLPAALLPYSIGGTLWFMRNQLLRYVEKIGLCSIVTIATILLICDALLVSKTSVTLSYILALPLLAMLILVLSPIKSGRIDDFLGQMSYPIYLTHMAAAYLFVVITYGLPTRELYYNDSLDNRYNFTALGFFGVTALTIIISVFLAALIERPLERVRHTLPAKIFR